MSADGPADLGLDESALGALTLGRFVAEIARRHGERTALVFEDRRVSYRELEREVRALAKGLLAAGVTKGSKVAVLMSNRPEWVVASFAVGMAGGVVVPMNTYAQADEIDYVLRHCDAQLLLVQPALLKHAYLADLLDRHPALGAAPFGRLGDPAFPYLRGIVALGDPCGARTWSWRRLLDEGRAVSDEILHQVGLEVCPSDDAMIIYTSGTTDRPKGVLHVHRAPCIQFWRWVDQLRLSPDDRVWSTFPFFWTAGFSMVLGGTLAAGGTLVMQEVFEPGGALELLERERVTMVNCWPHLQTELVDHPSARGRDLSSIRRLMHDSPLRQLPSVRSDDWDPGAAFGLSETFTICTSIPSDSPLELRRTTHGLPLPGMTIRIVDGDGRELATGSAGEIAVKGVTAMRAYYKVEPAGTFDRDGFFRTKDAGYLDDLGYLHWGGRLSALIKTAGANVSPVEVEQACVALGRLKTAAVVGVPHPTLGEAVVACAVRRPDDPVTEDEVRAHLKGALASYKVPRRILFVTEEELTFTGSQKVRVQDLRDLASGKLAIDEREPAWRRFLAARTGAAS